MTEEQATVWAEDICSRAEYSSGEILTRLSRRGVDYATARRIVSKLIENRFIDDARFARAFVKDKTEYARWGKRKVAASLAAKGIDRQTINDTIDLIDHERYISSLSTLLRAKASALHTDIASLDYATRGKLYRFGASRGFDIADISRAIEILKNYNDEDDE